MDMGFRDLALKNLGRRIAIELLLAVLIGGLLGLLGPFDTYRMGAGPRMAYWIGMIVAGLAIFRPTVIASDWLAAESRLPGWAARGLAIAIGSLPMTLLVAWLFSGFDVSRALQLPDLPVLYGDVLLISLLTNGVYHLVFQGRNQPLPFGEPDPALQRELTEPVTESAFLARLPGHFGALLALSSEDHYVRAYNDSSSVLILIRLRDAIGELGGAIAGEQVHRSWWVARDAVVGRKSDGRSVRLVLSNGLEVPVSRDRVAALKSAGWF
jgi:hypothetical protein